MIYLIYMNNSFNNFYVYVFFFKPQYRNYIAICITLWYNMLKSYTDNNSMRRISFYGYY